VSHSTRERHAGRMFTGERKRLFESEGGPDEQWLTPSGADEAERDREPAGLADRQA